MTETQSKKRKTPRDATEAGTQVKEPQGKKRTFIVWNHFDPEPSPFIHAVCHHCNRRIAVDTAKNGTGGLNNHLKIYKRKTETKKGQQTLDFKPNMLGEEGKLAAVTFSQDVCRKTSVLFIIPYEHPFRVVEGEGFKELCRVLESRFRIPSHMTISSDVLELYDA